MRRTILLCLAAAACSAAMSSDVRANAPAAEHGAFIIRMILHVVGEEHYYLSSNSDGTRTMTTTLDYGDRGNRRTTSAELTTTSDERPLSLEVKGTAPINVRAENNAVTIEMRGSARTIAAPKAWAAVSGPSPFALQMMMMRAWRARGEPTQMQIISPNADPEPLEIERVGRDVVTVSGKSIALTRYTVNRLMFGKEILWTMPDGDLAAVMTFAGGLPLEGIRAELDPAFDQLYRAGIAQEMANLAALGRMAPPVRIGDYAITGATLIDATGAAPIADSVVVIRNGRIAAAGPRSSTSIPAGLAIIDARGKTLVPGLWEMHTHASGVEFGPASLAAGITTMRDLGGEFDYLVAVRDAIEKRNALGPRMLLAGLIDAGGAKAFGHVTAETPDEARAAVRKYHAARFEQIKLYTFLSPEVVRAAADEAHKLGMTVAGHVPQSLTTRAGIEAGMDHINHLNYATSLLRGAGMPGANAQAPLDLQSETAKQAIKFLLDHHTVIDPTASWGEMSGHSREVDVATFEPGILTAPSVLDAKFRGMEGNTTAAQMKTRMDQQLAVIAALHKAGVPIVPGSDTGLVGFGLHREIELYVQAGMTPLQAIQSATIVSARSMGLDRDTGTIEKGKRADMILINGDPLTDIRALRNVVRVVANGRMFDASALWRAVGFRANVPQRRTEMY